MYYEVFCGVFGSIYLAIAVLIILRRNNTHVSKRTPWLILISHISNLGEMLLVLPTATEIVVKEDSSDTLWQVRDCGILIFHFLIYFPYLLRGYRILVIFSLTQRTDFSHNISKITQKFLIKFLALLMFPVLMLCGVILGYSNIALYFPISESHSSYAERTVASCIYVASTIIEQFIFVILIFKLRSIPDNYNMIKELILVAICWYISPIFSTFINTDRKVWLVSIVIRNFLILIVSSLLPIIYSYKIQQFEEPLTLEMLGSLEIILENPKCLKFFERFLSNSCTGQYVLEFYQKCECTLPSTSLNMYMSINNYIESRNLPSAIRVANIDDKEGVISARDQAFNYLNENFYQEFLRSEECIMLRELIEKEEILTSRVRKTSLYRKI